jgi:thiosulfate dehydrogenase [quinone] large subunit
VDRLNKTENISYFLAKSPLGMSMLGHGLIRITRIQSFSNEMVDQFKKSLLPQSLVLSFSYILPFFEFIIGLFLLTGLFTRYVCIAGVAIIIILIFGSSFLEQWNNIFIQLVYGAYFAILYRYSFYNYYSIDMLINKN